MKTLWLALLERAITGILSQDWNFLMSRVKYFMTEELTGPEKHALVVAELREVGNTLATWLLDIAVKMAYAKLAKKPLTQDSP